MRTILSAACVIALTAFSTQSLSQSSSVKLKTNKVTHYYVPLLGSASPNKRNCHSIEGVCKYLVDGSMHIYNYTGASVSDAGFEAYARSNDVPVADALCKHGKGYGKKTNCTHPCRSLAASTKHHSGGELLFFPKLVGVACGTGTSSIIHDGFMFVNDTGSPRHFNKTGRFDFFWGDCSSFNSNAVCLDGNALKIDRMLDNADYEVIWKPEAPDTNRSAAEMFTLTVQAEAVKRDDGPEAVKFDLMDFLPGKRHHRPKP